MSYMNEVAKMLGVELGEYFRIISNGQCYDDAKYCLKSSGLFKNDVRNAQIDRLLRKLLTGEFRIVRFPWTPRYKDTVYYNDCHGNVIETIFDIANGDHLLLYAMGQLYSSAEDAENHREEDLAEYAVIRHELTS